MRINITLDLDLDNDTITVSGDSNGIYPLSEEVLEGDLICDAIRGNQDAVEKATLKLTNLRIHNAIYKKNNPKWLHIKQDNC